MALLGAANTQFADGLLKTGDLYFSPSLRSGDGVGKSVATGDLKEILWI